MKTPRVKTDKLRKLAAFLRTLKPEQFDFTTVVSRYDENNCGTTCCAIGWCPAVFPEEISWTHKEIVFGAFHSVAARLFGLSRSESRLLFQPQSEVGRNQVLITFPGEVSDVFDLLPSTSTAEQVAYYIDWFCDRWDAAFQRSINWHQVEA